MCSVACRISLEKNRNKNWTRQKCQDALHILLNGSSGQTDLYRDRFYTEICGDIETYASGKWTKYGQFVYMVQAFCCF